MTAGGGGVRLSTSAFVVFGWVGRGRGVDGDPEVLLPGVGRGFFDQGCDLLGMGDVDCVAGAGDFDFVALGSRGVPAFEFGVDGSIFCGHQHPAWFAFPGGCGDDAVEIGVVDKQR